MISLNLSVKKALENSSVSEQSAQDVINELSNLFNFSCKKSAITNKKKEYIMAAKVISVVNNKGGVGKTTSTAFLEKS